MRLLLDTCTFLWLIWDEPPLPVSLRNVIADRRYEVFVSTVSVWEAQIKHRIGKLELRVDEPAWAHFTKQRKAHEIESLPFGEADLSHLDSLPDIHRDPFDRILICQAIEQGLALVTPDPAIRRYPIKTLWD